MSTKNIKFVVVNDKGGMQRWFLNNVWWDNEDQAKLQCALWSTELGEEVTYRPATELDQKRIDKTSVLRMSEK